MVASDRGAGTVVAILGSEVVEVDVGTSLGATIVSGTLRGIGCVVETTEADDEVEIADGILESALEPSGVATPVKDPTAGMRLTPVDVAGDMADAVAGDGVRNVVPFVSVVYEAVAGVDGLGAISEAIAV